MPLYISTGWAQQRCSCAHREYKSALVQETLSESCIDIKPYRNVEEFKIFSLGLSYF
jgi:hypothetical protein